MNKLKFLLVSLLSMSFLVGCGNKPQPTNYKVTFSMPNDYPTDRSSFPIPDEQTVADGNKVVKPDPSTYAASYTVDGITKQFDFWLNGGQQFNFETAEVHSDLNLIAQYTHHVATYTVNFIMPSDYRSSFRPSPQKIIEGGKVTNPQGQFEEDYIGERGGHYTFNRWVKEDEGGDEGYNFNLEVHSNFNLKAIYLLPNLNR